MFEEEYFKNRDSGLLVKHEHEVRKWIKHFGLKQGSKVFVHGCGFGQRLHWFLELGMNAWGMDVSKYAREHAYGRAKSRITNKISCKAPDKFWYNLVVSVDVLEHLDDNILVDTLIKLSNLSYRGVYGITYNTSPTHVQQMSKSDWKKFLNKYYDRVYDAPQDWFESDMYLICYRFNHK